MIIAVSDLHLGDMAANREGFIGFTEDYLKPRREEITDLILLGDIVDLWRRDNKRVIEENKSILREICSQGFRVRYLVGNHDMALLDSEKKQSNAIILKNLICDSEDLVISENHKLSSGGLKFSFIHGHQMDYWYALPFYEAFCRSMCHVAETRSDEANVWKLMSHESDGYSQCLGARIDPLPDIIRFQIEEKLAGPLEGRVSSREESMLDDLKLLHEFIEFRSHNEHGIQRNVIESVRKEVSFPSDHDTIQTRIESWDEFTDIIKKGTYHEIASQLLITWSDILQLIISNKSRMKEANRSRLLGVAKRLAATFSRHLNHDEFLIHGHGHRAFLDIENRVADTGCWLGKKATYISIDDGRITCNHWPY